MRWYWKMGQTMNNKEAELLNRADGYIDTLQQGHDLIAEIVAERKKTMIEMQMTDNHAMWQQLADYRHNLSLAKRQVQSKMQKIVIAKRGGRNALRFK